MLYINQHYRRIGTKLFQIHVLTDYAFDDVSTAAKL